MSLFRCPACSHTWEAPPGGPTCPACRTSVNLAPELTVPPTLPPVSPHDAPTVNAPAPLPRPPEPAPPPTDGFDYHIIGSLGRGGMGVVFLARQISLDRLVALKRLPEDFTADDVARLRDEGAKLAALKHPNIVTVYGAGEHDGRPYLALEYCAGGSLAQRLHEKALPPRDAAALVAALARAIHAANDAGLIHCDLKPANVLFSQEGTPKVCDFGLARVAAARTASSSAGAFGTPAYMAPEQAHRKARIDRPTDVYGLGAILYHCLTKRPPYPGEVIHEILIQVCDPESAPVPPRVLTPALPHDLDTICLKCLHKAPADRYRSAEELALDLERFLRGETIAARSFNRAERTYRWCRRNPVVAGLLALVALALLAGTAVSSAFYWRESVQRQEAEAEKQRAIRSEADARRVRIERQLTTARLCQRIAAQHAQRGDDDLGLLWLGHALKALPDPLPPGEEKLEEQIRIALGVGLRQIHPLRAELRHEAPVRLAAFSPDGLRVVTLDEAGNLSVFAADGGERIARLTLDEADRDAALAFSGDGRLGVGAALVVNLADGEITPQGPLDALKWRRWAPISPVQGVANYAQNNNAELLKLAAPKGRATLVARRNRSVQVTRQDRPGPQPLAVSADVRAGAFSDDGRFVTLALADRTCRLYDVNTGEPISAPLRHDRDVTAVAFRPGAGDLILTVSRASVRLWQRAKDVSPSRLATIKPGGRVVGAAFASSGGLVATASNADGQATVRTWNADTGRPVAQIAAWSEGPLPATFGLRSGKAVSPTLSALRVFGDAKLIYAGGHRCDDLSSGRCELADVEGGRLGVVELPANVAAVAASEDGRHFATATDDGACWLWERGPAAGQARQARAGIHAARPLFDRSAPALTQAVAFRPDGQRVFTLDRAGAVRAWETAGDVAAELLFEVKGSAGVLAVSRQGDRLAVVAAAGVHVYEAQVEARPRTLPLKGVTAAAFSPDGKSVLLGCDDGGVRLWSLVSDGVLPLLERHQGRRVTAVAFTPLGDRFLSAGADGAVEVSRLLEPAAGGEEEINERIERETGLRLREEDWSVEVGGE